MSHSKLSGSANFLQTLANTVNSNKIDEDNLAALNREEQETVRTLQALKHINVPLSISDATRIASGLWSRAADGSLPDDDDDTTEVGNDEIVDPGLSHSDETSDEDDYDDDDDDANATGHATTPISFDSETIAMFWARSIDVTLLRFPHDQRLRALIHKYEIDFYIVNGKL